MANQEVDWSQFTDEEVEAITQGNLTALSDQKTALLAGESARGPSSPYKLLQAAANIVTAGPVGAGQAVVEGAPPEWLPTIGTGVGMTLGNMSGIPFGGTLGAAVGGMGGEAKRQLRTGEELDPGRVGWTGVGSAASALAGRGIERGAKALGRFSSTRLGGRFGKQMAGKVADYRRGANVKFGGALDRLQAKSPLGKVNVTQEMKELAKEIKNNPNLRQLLEQGARNEGDDVLLQLLDGKLLPDQLSLAQAQRVGATINRIPKIAHQLPAGQGGQYLPSERPLMKFKSGVRQQTDKSFDGYEEVLSGHQKTLSGVRDLEGRLRPSRLHQGGTPNVSGNPDLRGAYKRAVPRRMRVEAGDVETLNTLKRNMRWLGPLGVIGYGLTKFVVDPIVKSNQSSNR